MERFFQAVSESLPIETAERCLLRWRCWRFYPALARTSDAGNQPKFWRRCSARTRNRSWDFRFVQRRQLPPASRFLLSHHAVITSSIICIDDVCVSLPRDVAERGQTRARKIRIHAVLSRCCEHRASFTDRFGVAIAKFQRAITGLSPGIWLYLDDHLPLTTGSAFIMGWRADQRSVALATDVADISWHWVTPARAVLIFTNWKTPARGGLLLP